MSPMRETRIHSLNEEEEGKLYGESDRRYQLALMFDQIASGFFS